MNSQANQGPRQRRYTVRHQARLDASTLTRLEELASACHHKRSAILRFVMQWGLRHSSGWTIDRSPVVAVPSVPMLLEPELLQQVHDAAAAHAVSIAAWLREALRRITVGDFPASWRVGETAGRSHDSGYYGQRFMLRIDEITTQKLQLLVEHFGRSRAEIIRQLVAQATPKDFPQRWQLARDEQRQRETQPRGGA